MSDVAPEGWIDCHTALPRVRDRIVSALGDLDPTPWLADKSPEYWGPFSASEVEATKLGLRVAATMQRAFLDGALTPSLFIGSEFRSLPIAAFLDGSVVRNGLFIGALELDPLWPDDWQEWSGCGWAIPEAQFAAWLDSPDAVSGEGLPPVASPEAENTVERLSSREPSLCQFVPLAEAISWIAFGLALDSERLARTISWASLCKGNFAEANQKIEAAATRLLDAGIDGKVTFMARHVATWGERGALTERIDAIALRDYRLFLIHSHDLLYYGEGMAFVPIANNKSHGMGSVRSDLYSHVAVNRAELLQQFHPEFHQSDAHPLQSGDGPIAWDDFGSECLPELQKLREIALRDEWWTWPEAIAWVGGRDPKNIATLRYWGREWWEQGGGDATITLAAQAYMAKQYCKSGDDAEAELMNAIQCGQIGTSGRLSKGALAIDLSPSVWRGGAVVWTGGEAVLVDAKHKLAAWVFDVAIRRKDLVASFPAEAGLNAMAKTKAKPSSEPLPPLSEAKLAAWWGKLPANDRQMPLDKLLELSRSAFPSNSIARQRVRDLDPGRKRGPKPLSGKMMA